MLNFPELEQTSDEELVTMVLTKGHGYFGHLMKRYEAKLLRYIGRLSGLSNDDAEDVLQDIFIKAYLNLNAFDPKYKFANWIYQIAHNQIISNFRKQQSKGGDRLIKIEDDLFTAIAAELDLNQEVDNHFIKNLLLEQIALLERKYQDVLILKYFEDKDYQEISFILKLPVGTVGNLINRAKKQLKDRLSKINF